MLSFAGSLSPDSEAFAIFVNDKLHFRDRKNILSNEVSKKIKSYLETLKDKNLLQKMHFNIGELDTRHGILTICLNAQVPVASFEVEILKVIGESIEGIREVKMTVH